MMYKPDMHDMIVVNFCGSICFDSLYIHKHFSNVALIKTTRCMHVGPMHIH